MSTDLSGTTATPATSSGTRVPVRRERLIGAAAFLAGIVVYFAITLLERSMHPSHGSPFSEVPVKTAFGAVGWIMGFGLAMIAPHRARDSARVSRPTAVVLLVVAVAAIPLFFWCSLPVLLALAALLLVRRASTLDAPRRFDRVVGGLAVLVMVASPAFLLVYNTFVVTG